MGAYRCFLLLVICALWSCEKGGGAAPEIFVVDVHVDWIKSNRVDINYRLSSSGYGETGVIYYKKNEPENKITVKAIRADDVLRLQLLNLEANTDYVFKVFFKQNDEQKEDTKEYAVKTLSEDMAKFVLTVRNSTIQYDEDGNFTAEIEGDNLNNLNLSQLVISVNNSTAILDYPALDMGNKYIMTLRGKINPIINATSTTVVGVYQGEQILFQTIPGAFDVERYRLIYKPTNLRRGSASVFDDKLYYFTADHIYEWDETDERMLPIGKGPGNHLPPSVQGIQFGSKLFFPLYTKVSLPYPEVSSYSPADDKWVAYPKTERLPTSWYIKNSYYFIHKNELYLDVTLADPSFTTAPIKTYNYLYRYNKSADAFESVSVVFQDIVDYKFISVEDRLYLVGRVPVYDQGYKLGATLAVFRVDDASFKTQEIFRGGTVTQPLDLIPTHLVNVNRKVLIAVTLHDFLIFDPSTNEMSQVFPKQQISNMYLGNFFYYNNKLHLNSDLLFTSQMVYEISVYKGR